jgi:hypothetical protein
VVPLDAATASARVEEIGTGSMSWLGPLGLGLMGFGIVVALVGRLSGVRLSTVRVRLPRLSHRRR